MSPKETISLENHKALVPIKVFFFTCQKLHSFLVNDLNFIKYKFELKKVTKTAYSNPFFYTIYIFRDRG